MDQTMKASAVRAYGQPLTIADVPLPVSGTGEMLVRVLASGVCPTDLHAADGEGPVKPVAPFSPGHEVAGVVAALGPSVSDFALGDALGVG